MSSNESHYAKQVRIAKEDVALLGGLLPHEQLAHARKREAYIKELEARLKRESIEVGWPFLKDRADGVRGRYCIARIKDSQGTHEYWNEGNKWSAFGQIVLDLTDDNRRRG